MASTAAVLNILVAANTAPASAQLTALSGQLKATSAQAGATSTAIGSGLSKNAKIGAAGMAAAGVAAIAVGKALVSSVKAASDFESSFAEVRKTVDTNEQGFKNIERGLRGLAKRIPVSVHELNNLAGEAGALGIKSKDIVRFTEVAAKLGTTTNLSSSEAANALARLSNIMGTSSKDFKNLASTLVGLGNAGASTEAEIAEMALRIAGTGKQVGLSEAQVLGFSSALASVGINAEAGGSAISRAFSLMSEAVATSNEDLAKFAEVADMSAPAFSKLFEKDASKAMLAFTEGLSKSKNAIATLAELDINDVRLRDALLRAAGASELFREQLGLANQEFRDGKALDKEAQKRYDTFAAKVETLKNRFYDLKITVGNALLPVLSDFASELDLAFRQLDGTTRKTTSLGTAFKIVSAIVYGLGKGYMWMFRTAKAVHEGLQQFAKGTADAIKAAFGVIESLIKGKWSKAWSRARSIVSNQVKAIVGVVKAMGAPFSAAFQTIVEIVRDKFKSAYNAAAGFVRAILKVVNLIPGVDIEGPGNLATRTQGEMQIRGTRVKKQRGGVLNGGRPSGDSIPAMLERGEYVLNREAVKKVGVQRLNELNFKGAPRFQQGGPIGMNVGGAVSDAADRGIGLAKKAVDLVAKGPSAFINMLPKPNLPEPITGAGPYVIDKAKDYITKKVRSLLQSQASSGVPGYVGPPPDFRQLGNNAWVDANTLAVGYYLANKFGVSITDGWRPQNASYGAINSSHKRGTPGNPGALDFAPPSTALQAFAAKRIAGLTENDIHDWGTGLHNHIAFFQRGGLAGKLLKMAKGGWVKTGYTVFDDAGGGYLGSLQKGNGYAELGTAYPYPPYAATGKGLIARALGMSGELPHKYPLDVKINGKIKRMYKRDRGWGQGDTYHSIDIYKDSWPFFGISGSSKGNAWIRPGSGKVGDTGKSKAEIEKAKKEKARRKKVIEKIGAAGFKYKDRGPLAKNAKKINTLQERIQVAEALAGANFGPGGSDETDQEIAEQKKLYKQLFELQKKRAQLILKAISEIQRRIRAYQAKLNRMRGIDSGGVSPSGKDPKADKKWKQEGFENGIGNAQKTLKQLRGSLRGLVGITGMKNAMSGKFSDIFSGDLGSTNLTLKNLGVKTSDASGDSELASLLREQLTVSQRNLAIAQAQAPIFQQFMPKFHQGGIVQGPRGAERPIMAQAGEGVFTRDQMRAMGGNGNITVVIEDGAIDSNRIRVEVDGVLQDKISTVRRTTPNRRYSTR